MRLPEQPQPTAPNVAAGEILHPCIMDRGARSPRLGASVCSIPAIADQHCRSKSSRDEGRETKIRTKYRPDCKGCSRSVFGKLAISGKSPYEEVVLPTNSQIPSPQDLIHASPAPARLGCRLMVPQSGKPDRSPPQLSPTMEPCRVTFIRWGRVDPPLMGSHEASGSWVMEL
jgi:hypothetical protein